MEGSRIFINPAALPYFRSPNMDILVSTIQSGWDKDIFFGGLGSWGSWK